MSLLDEVQTNIRQLAEGAGASVVGIGQRWGVGSGIVLGDGRVLTNAHNVRGDQVTVTFADGRTAEGSVAGHDIDGDLAVIEVDTAGAAALPWASGTAAELGMPVFALSNPGGRGLRVTFGFVSGIERTFRGPARPAHHRQPGAHRAAAARLIRRPGAERGRAAARASTPTGSVRASTWPSRPTRRSAAGSTRWAAASRRRRHRGWAWRWRPVTWPGGCAARSACRRPTACSSAGWKRTARPPGPVWPRAT